MNFELPLHVRQDLRNLGLSDQDTLILAYLLMKGKSTLLQISRATVISYSTCHYICTNLQRLGLLSASGSGKSEHFQIRSKMHILDWIDQQRKASDDRYEAIRGNLSHFILQLTEESWKPEVSYYEGVEGLRAIYSDFLETRKHISGWTDISRIQKTLGKKFMESYIRERVARNIESQSIVPKNAVNTSYMKKDQLRQIKIIQNLPIPGEIRIYGDKVAIITFEGEKPVGIVMKGGLIRQIFQTVFDNAWNMI